MKENHETLTTTSCKRLKLDVSTLIHRFLAEDTTSTSDPQFKDFDIPDHIDVIKNPPFKLPLTDFFQQSSPTSETTSNKSKSQFSITIIERKHSTTAETDSDSNDENFEPNDSYNNEDEDNPEQPQQGEYNMNDDTKPQLEAKPQHQQLPPSIDTVSYTHLTLPTTP